MAYTGFSNTNYFLSTLAPSTPITMACFAVDTVLTTAAALMTLGDNASSGDLNQHKLATRGASGLLEARSGDASASSFAAGTVAATAGVWFHACAVFASATDRRIYTNGGDKQTNATSRAPVSVNRTGLGRRVTGGQPLLTGSLAECAIWSIALSDADIAALALGIDARLIHPEALIGYWPLGGIGANEPNIVSASTPAVMQGTLTVAPHSRILKAA